MNWQEIWEKKGLLPTQDLLVLNGGEHTSIHPPRLGQLIKEHLEFSAPDSVLEIGCGAGVIAQYLGPHYVGVDYSQSLVKKHIALLQNSVLHAHAHDLPFKDKSFDKVFAHSVFHYFSDHDYARLVLAEMKRVARSLIFVGDLPVQSHRPQEHLLYSPSFFAGWELSAGFFNPDRFNARLKL